MDYKKEIELLNNKLCCKSTKFYDTLADFPTTGKSNTLYVDKETGSIYIWNGSAWVTPTSYSELCAPTGEKVYIKSDYTGVTYTNLDGSAYIGDITLLEKCCCEVPTSTFTSQNVPYTGVELPLIPGQVIGDNVTVSFSDGDVVNYVWDGTAWLFNRQVVFATRYQEDIFTGLTSGSTVTLTQLPVTIIGAYRNGLNQMRGTGLDYNLSGTTATFDTPFASSGGGTGAETVRFFYTY